ncbi:hypothetical protein [Desulforhabdus sp. TSK]|uniref:hypothetical protein n=1 Tax=Desulforhabdus sp. TSK TaxID=2925014 RepID=UPI001FC7D050|nr:hypothetical protein [Desulforhabdus sp. TSK]
MGMPSSGSTATPAKKGQNPASPFQAIKVCQCCISTQINSPTEASAPTMEAIRSKVPQQFHVRRSMAISVAPSRSSSRVASLPLENPHKDF